MSPDISRREFLQKAGILAAGLSLTGCAAAEADDRLVPFRETPEEQVAGVFTPYASVCGQCPAGCGILAATMNGRAHKLEGNPQHPVSQGRLCARGQAGLQALYNPDRVPGPKRRVNGRENLEFEGLAWSDAVGQLADALAEAGPRVAAVGGQIPDHLYRLVGRMLETVGAGPPVVWDLFRAAEGRTQLLDVTREVFGVRRLPVLDIGRSDFVVSFGANFLETWLSPVLYARGYSELRRGTTRGTLVQVEPRFSLTAANADFHLAPPAGREGDTALLMGRIVLDESLASPDRPEAVDDLFAGVDSRSVSAELGLDFEEVVQISRRLARSAAPLCLPGGSLSAFTGGVGAMRAVLALNLLTGAVGNTIRVPPPPPGGQALEPLEAVSEFAEVRRLVERMAGGEVQVLLVLDGDPLHDLPAALGFAQAAEQVPLVVSFSPFPTDTSVFLADLVLPAPTYLESWGWSVPQPSTGLATITARQPVVNPVHDTLPVADVLLAAAAEIGGALGDSAPWSNEREYVQSVVSGLELGGEGSILASEPEEFFHAWRRFGGWWATREEAEPVLPEIPGPVRLTSAPEREGQDRFRLQIYPHLLLAEGRHANLPWCQETPDPMTTVTWESWIEVNPAVARELDLRTGDLVRVTSSAGEVVVPAYVYPGVGPDTVAMPLGQGHETYGRYAADRGVNPATLLELVETEDGRELAWGETWVALEKTGESVDLARLEQGDTFVLPTGLGGG
ncbi:MAG: molybdopterin-dependent oxidoreductase [Thermoleophilia bacterium]